VGFGADEDSPWRYDPLRRSPEDAVIAVKSAQRTSRRNRGCPRDVASGT
jgi:hypothetical protein